MLIRITLASANAVGTLLFSYVFAWAWTDELVDGNGKPPNVGTAIDGASAAVLPVAVGLLVGWWCLNRTQLPWWWMVCLTVGSGGAGAVFATASRYPEGIGTGPAWAFAVLAVAGLVGMVHAAGRNRAGTR